MPENEDPRELTEEEKEEGHQKWLEWKRKLREESEWETTDLTDVE